MMTDTKPQQNTAHGIYNSWDVLYACIDNSYFYSKDTSRFDGGVWVIGLAVD